MKANIVYLGTSVQHRKQEQLFGQGRKKLYFCTG